LKPFAGQLPAPSQNSVTSQAPLAARHCVVVGALFGLHVPAPSQVSGALQAELLESPQALPAALNAFAGQLPAPSQNSATSQAPLADRHCVVVGALFELQVPAPSQVSAPLHTVLVESPHAVPAVLKPFAGQLPAPSQNSATSHEPLAARHWTVVAALFGLHVPVPSQVSGALQTELVESPHAVPAGLKPFAGQLPAPSQNSATSQAPLAARHCVVEGASFRLHVPAPSQVSGALQAELLESPQAVPAGALEWRQIRMLESQVSEVQGLWSSQSPFELQPDVMMQSDGSEFGCIDGYEQTSVRTAVPPNSDGLMQQVARASSVVQLGPAHLLLECEGRPAKGSAGRLAVHAALQAIETLDVQRSGRESPHW
jgi:hypothetical protein